MMPVGRLSEFPKVCNVWQFSGKSYEEAIKNSGGNWISYFQQEKLPTSKLYTILVCYTKKEASDDTDSIGSE